jgi:capsular polysaccharide biosynthesis protein
MNKPDKLDEEIGLRDILIKLRGLYRLLRPHFILISILSIVGGAIGFGYAYFMIPKYEAKLTFMVDAGKSNSMGGVSQLASTFGLGLGSGGSNLDSKKLENLLLSNRINIITLFEKETLNGKTDFLANHFINVFELKKTKEFVKNDSIKDFTEFKSADYKNFTLKENRVLNIILNKIVSAEGALVVEVSKDEIITVRFTSISKFFAKYYVEHLVNALTDFYVSSSIKKEKISLDIITHRADSIKQVLYSAEYTYAAFKDENLRMIKVQGFVEELRLKRNVEMLNAMYAEIVKSKEMAIFAMLNKTPIFQVIEEPRFPLKGIAKSPYSFFVYGCIFSFILMLSLVIIIKLLQDYRKMMID